MDKPIGNVSILPCMAVLLLAMSSASCTVFQGREPAPGIRFETIVHDYFQWRWRTTPISATGAGIHTYDDRLDETGPDAVRKRIAALHAFRDRMNALDASRLDHDQDLDRRLFLAGMDRRLFELEILEAPSRFPQETMNRLGAGLQPLLDLNGVPMPAYRDGLQKRLACVPEYLEGAQACLEHPPALYTRVAIDRCKGLENLVASILSKAGGEPALESSARSALDALYRFHRFLEEDLLPESSGDFRLGSELYAKAFRATYWTVITPEELLALAEEEIARIHQEMFEVASGLYPRLFPGRAAELKKAVTRGDRARMIRAVIDAISADHPEPEGYADAIRDSLEEIRRFIRAKDLLDLPEPDFLRVEPMPEYARGYSIAYFEPAPLFDPGQNAFYRYSPVPDHWPAARKESFMREYNDHMIRIFAIHEAIPGHYIQSERASRNPSFVRRFFGSGPYIEGWAVYCEKMMLDAGFGSGDPRLKLMQLKWTLRTVANTSLDIRLHTQGMKDEEVIRFLEDEAFQEEAEALGKLQRAKLSHVQLTMYFLGLLQMRDLRRFVEERSGTAFSLKDFHHKVLDYGPLPLELIKEEWFKN